MLESHYDLALADLHRTVAAFVGVYSDADTGRVMCRGDAGDVMVLCVAEREGELAGTIRSYYLGLEETPFRAPLRYRVDLTGELPPPREQTGGDLLLRVPAASALTAEEAAELTAMVARSTRAV